MRVSRVSRTHCARLLLHTCVVATRLLCLRQCPVDDWFISTAQDRQLRVWDMRQQKPTVRGRTRRLVSPLCANTTVRRCRRCAEWRAQPTLPTLTRPAKRSECCKRTTASACSTHAICRGYAVGHSGATPATVAVTHTRCGGCLAAVQGPFFSGSLGKKQQRWTDMKFSASGMYLAASNAAGEVLVLDTYHADEVRRRAPSCVAPSRPVRDMPV